jgi:hypothetical protein
MHSLPRLLFSAFKFALILWLAMIALYFLSGIPILEAILKANLE